MDEVQGRERMVRSASLQGSCRMSPGCQGSCHPWAAEAGMSAPGPSPTAPGLPMPRQLPTPHCLPQGRTPVPTHTDWVPTFQHLVAQHLCTGVVSDGNRLRIMLAKTCCRLCSVLKTIIIFIMEFLFAKVLSGYR